MIEALNRIRMMESPLTFLLGAPPVPNAKPPPDPFALRQAQGEQSKTFVVSLSNHEHQY
jgi:hypothetical protein